MFVYMIQNKTDGKIYIGIHSGTDLRAYLKSKFLAARKGQPSCLYSAIREHGENQFSIIPIHSVASGQLTRKELGDLERYYIKSFRSRDPLIGYNLTDGGDGVAVYRPTLEHRQKLRERLKGNKRGCNAKGRPANSGTFRKGHQGYRNSANFRPGHKLGIGRIVSEATRMRMSRSRKGKRVSRSTEFKKGQIPWNKGLPLPEEQKLKLIAAHKGKRLTAEHRAKLSAAHKGRVFSEEHRRNIGAGQRGRIFSPETRAKMSAAAMGRKHSEETIRKFKARVPWNKGKSLSQPQQTT